MIGKLEFSLDGAICAVQVSGISTEARQKYTFGRDVFLDGTLPSSHAETIAARLSEGETTFQMKMTPNHGQISGDLFDFRGQTEMTIHAQDADQARVSLRIKKSGDLIWHMGKAA